MARPYQKYKELTAPVLVSLKPEERDLLKQILFDRGNITMQSFFRQAALQAIRAAQAARFGGHDAGELTHRVPEPADVAG